MEAEAWLADFQAKAEEMRRKADQAQEQLASASGTASSADGAVTVTVGPGGILQNVQFGQKVKSHSPDRLAALVMETFGQAQAQSANAALETFSGLGYSDDAVAKFKQFMPSTQAADESGDARSADEYEDGDDFEEYDLLTDDDDETSQR